MHSFRSFTTNEIRRHLNRLQIKYPETMPKATKNGAGKKEAVGGKKNKIYSMPEKIPEGTVLTDLHKRRWRVGPSIGVGGFGEIYSACKDGESKYDYVVKCEPQANGPLFVEMHFYMRNGKEADLKSYQKKQGLKSLGMPHMISNGSLPLNGIDHRYIVMPRYGNNVEHYFLANGRRLPVGTAYRLAIQMLDVYEYVHQCGYIHADLKASNILLGLGKNGNAQAYLVDFGLASRYFTERDFKPDPKKAHNGTIEYTSRDAHQGVPTMRADLEIFGYNLIHWLGAELPWVRDKLLTAPTKVQAAKVEFMSNIEAELRKLFPAGVPAPLLEYMKYVAKMQYNEQPDYKKCRKIFQDGLKALKISDSGDLELTLKGKSPTGKVTTQRKRTAAAVVESEDDNEQQRNASDDDDGDVVFPAKTRKISRKPGTLKSVNVQTPTKKASPKKTTPRRASPRKPISIKTTAHKSPSPRKRASPRTATAASPSPTRKKAKATPPSTSKRATPLSARANINFSPAISLAQKTSSSLASRNGSTVINNNITPNPRANKTYEFNVELNVSMDADVIVNVKRKKKTASSNAATNSPKGTPKASTVLSNGSPMTRVKVQKLNSGSDENSSSPRTPIVLLKKTK